MIVQRAIEKAGIPTIIIAALPPVVRQNGSPRAVAPLVPMGANAGEPNNKEMQTNILKDTLRKLIEIPSAGKIIPLPYEYVAEI
ncbi:D-proline reductase (dithiol) PrdB [Tepidibacter formicigenes DSM 15518]|uniref:D-proline reductase (Dithiol) PrdB n=1 Tax=Tepidibacter formicigenes DSM 15518 TaxID=1123349 RepID=A0A1M6L868_9FIRM|nr:D-proline reductase (dithiol) PrdB [Tepidibacter formicigenes DSM 15518]